MNLFAQRLKQVRQHDKKTQKQIAEMLGISDRAYQNYEYGNREPNLETIITLANYFDIPLDYLTARGLFKDWEMIMAHKDDLFAVLTSMLQTIDAPNNTTNLAIRPIDLLPKNFAFDLLDEKELINLLPLLISNVEYNEKINEFNIFLKVLIPREQSVVEQ